MAATAGFMNGVTCRLSTKNRDQLRNPTLGSRVWATFTFTLTPKTYKVSVRSACLTPFRLGLRLELSGEADVRG